jgi:hypothetical protein
LGDGCFIIQVQGIKRPPQAFAAARAADTSEKRSGAIKLPIPVAAKKARSAVVIFRAETKVMGILETTLKEEEKREREKEKEKEVMRILETTV